METLGSNIPAAIVLQDLTTLIRVFNDVPISMKSARYKLFKEKGVKCIACNVKGTHFRVQRHSSTQRYHLNLYTNDGLLMTKDHIIPKSKGGGNTQDNYQPMCTICNREKDNKL